MSAPEEGLREFLLYHRRMTLIMLGTSVGVAAALFLAMGDRAWWGGYVVGAAAQLVKFAFVDLAVVRRIAVERNAAAALQLKSTLFTLVLFGAAVAVLHTLRLNVWAMAAGIFLPRLILWADAYFRPDVFAVRGDDGDAKR